MRRKSIIGQTRILHIDVQRTVLTSFASVAVPQILHFIIAFLFIAAAVLIVAILVVQR
jgi:hypothetical protein